MPTRRVLIGTIGATPQVVTETVWSLANRNPPWVPDEVHIVTTAFRLAFVQAALQAADGRLAGLMGAAFPPVTIHVPRKNGAVHRLPAGPGPGPAEPADLLQDVHTEQDAAVMGNLILRLLAGFAADPDTELHVSLAGGRKTMSAHALMALSLVGRLRDKASHVLVGPIDYEDHPEFWHPDQRDWLHTRAELRMAPEHRPSPSLDPSRATVVLIPTPAPLMRHRVRQPADLETLDLIDLVRRANLAALLQDNPRVTLNRSDNTITAGGVTVPLAPKSFALYRLLAVARREGWPPGGDQGGNPQHRGWLTFRQVCDGNTPARRPIWAELLDYLKAAERVKGVSDPDASSLSSTLWHKMASRGRSEEMVPFLSQGRTHLNTAIQNGFGDDASAILALQSSKKQGVTRLGLTMPPAAIGIVA